MADPPIDRFEPVDISTEPIDEYRPGGLHPVLHGDVLGKEHYGKRRFKIVRKLGHGAYSTVWLAFDTWSDTVGNNSVVAIKVLRADSPVNPRERQIHKLIEESPIESYLKTFVVEMFDDFEEKGPNGIHQCLVLEPMGLHATPILAEARKNAKALSKAKTILKDVLTGLHCLHTCGFAHGDLHPGNVLASLRDFGEKEAIDLAFQKSQTPVSVLERKDRRSDKWAPQYVCAKRPLTHLMDPDEEVKFKLADLGSAFPFDKPPAVTALPRSLRAPQIVLSRELSEKMDIWAFGCLIFLFLTGNRLFTTYKDADDAFNDDTHLLQMTFLLENLPTYLYKHWPRYNKYYEPNRKLIRTDCGPSETPTSPVTCSPSLAVCWYAEAHGDMEEDETDKVYSVIRKCLQYDPTKRPSTKELMEDEWFKSIP